jgi:hypothetical protein
MGNYYCSKCGYALSGPLVSECPRCGASLKGTSQASGEQISDANKRYREAHRSRFLPRIELTNKLTGIVIIVLAVLSFLACLILSLGAHSSTPSVPFQQPIFFLFLIPIPAIALGILTIRDTKFWDIVGILMLYLGIFFGISSLLGVLVSTPNESGPLLCGFPSAIAGALLLGIRFWKKRHQK